MLAEDIGSTLKEERRVENNHGLEAHQTVPRELRQRLDRDGCMRAILQPPVQTPASQHTDSEIRLPQVHA